MGDGDEPKTGPPPASAPRSPSRARKASECTTTEQRVEWIARLMSKGRWHGYESRVKLALAWELSEERIRNLAAEAHRLVAFDPKEREALRTSLAKTLKRIAEKAEKRSNAITGLPDWKAAIEATVQYAKFAGIELDDALARPPAPPKIEIVLAPEDDAAPAASTNEDRSVEVPSAEPGVPSASTG